MGNTIPGGYYLGEDGKPHDAWGNVVEKQSAKAIEKEAKDAETDPIAAEQLRAKMQAEREAAERQRAADEAAARAKEAAKAANARRK